MIYGSSVKKAMNIAYKIHHGQFDKCGYPYIHHVLHIAEQCNTEAETVVALLHDTVEDGGHGAWDLIIHTGFSIDILEAVDAITKRKHETYRTYIARVNKNEIAKKIKIIDLKHNSDGSRGEVPESLMDRYTWALEYLTNN